VIGNGVDVPVFRAAEPKYAAEIGKGRKVAVGMVGRMVWEKGPQYLIEAARDVIHDFPDTIFILIGDGPQRLQFQQMARSLGIERQVIFAGYRSDMPEVLASLDVVALPSLREAMPMSVMEAMAAGRPVIGTRVGAIPAMIADGKTGLLVDPGNPAQLREALVRLLANAKLRGDLGEQAQFWVAKHVSLEAVALRYLGAYEDLVHQGRQVA
jgi:glycosyltransferase involved in cell wall biosynthesis